MEISMDRRLPWRIEGDDSTGAGGNAMGRPAERLGFRYDTVALEGNPFTLPECSLDPDAG